MLCLAEAGHHGACAALHVSLSHLVGQRDHTAQLAGSQGRRSGLSAACYKRCLVLGFSSADCPNPSMAIIRAPHVPPWDLGRGGGTPGLSCCVLCSVPSTVSLPAPVKLRQASQPARPPLWSPAVHCEHGPCPDRCPSRIVHIQILMAEKNTCFLSFLFFFFRKLQNILCNNWNSFLGLFFNPVFPQKDLGGSTRRNMHRIKKDCKQITPKCTQ